MSITDVPEMLRGKHLLPEPNLHEASILSPMVRW